MKITNTTLAIIAFAVIVVIGFIFALTYADKDTVPLITFLGTILIPSAIALVANHNAQAAKEFSEEAKDLGVTTVKQTNGRISHLVSIIEAQGGKVPDEYASVARVGIIPQVVQMAPTLPNPRVGDHIAQV